MFEGFTLERIDVGDAELRVRHGGSGPAVLLLHGHPRTHVTGRRISCPVLFLWARRDDMEDLYGDPLAIWRDWADDLAGHPIDCGHHIAEEAPAELASDLVGFFARSG